ERAPSRVATMAARGRRDGAGDDVDELSGRVQRESGDDRASDPPGEALLAVARDERGQLVLRVLVAHDRGGELLAGVHAHVERRVVPIGEATFRSVELRARDTEVHEHTHDRLLPVAGRLADD